MIDHVSTEKVPGTSNGVTRARVGGATACYYHNSRRVVLVADGANFAAAVAALGELALEVLAPGGGPPGDCICQFCLTHGGQSAP